MTQVAVNETLVNDALRFSAYQTAEETIEEALKIFISFKTQRGETGKANEDNAEKDSYETGKQYFGRYGSGRGNLSRDYKTLVREKLHDKYGSH